MFPSKFPANKPSSREKRALERTLVRDVIEENASKLQAIDDREQAIRNQEQALQLRLRNHGLLHILIFNCNYYINTIHSTKAIRAYLINYL